MSKFAKGLLGTTLLGLGLQLFVLLRGDVRLGTGLPSSALSICLAILATAAAAGAACVPNRYARRFWRLIACGFLLLTAAEVLGAYYDTVLHAPLDSVWPSDLLYFLFIAPMAMVLFLRGRARHQGVDWAQSLDFFQVAILVATVYLYYFYLPSHWQADAPVMERLQWKFEVARDVLVLGAFAIRVTFARSRLEKSLLWRLGVFLGLFTIGNVAFLYRQNAYGLDAGTLWDMCYSVPIVMAVACACTWRLPEGYREDAESLAIRRESWGSLWMSVLVPLLVLGVATRMIHERPLLATVVAVSTLAAAGLRIVLTQQQQQKAAQAVIEAEQKFRAMFHDNPQPTCLYDPANGQFLEINRAATDKYGYSRAEFLALTVRDICLNLTPERLEAARQGVEFRDEIWQQRRKDGSIIDVQLFARTVEFDGRSARLVVTQDVTERRQSEELQSALYRIAEVSTTSHDLPALYPAIHAIVADLLDAKNFYIALFDHASNWLTFPYFVDEFDEAPPARVPKRGLTEYVLRTGEPLLATGQKINELAGAGEVERAGSPADDWLGVPLKQDGKTFGVLAVQHYAARTHFGEREKEVLTFVSHQVASAIERKRNEEALWRSEARYRSLVESAVVGIYRATIDGRFLDVNPALVAMLGYQSASEVLTRSLQRDVFDDDHAKALLNTSFLRQGRFEGVEARWKRKDGSAMVVRLSGRGVRDEREGAEVFEVIAEDVTERRALEEQLRQAQKMEAVGTLAGGIAHDFNNLLTVVNGYCQILMEQHAGDARSVRSIEQVLRAADRAASLTRQMLAFSRRQMLQPRVVNLNTLVGGVEKMLQPLLGERTRIVLQREATTANIKADPGQLEHILMNLAVNARDAMPRGGSIAIHTGNVDLGEDFARSHPGAAPGRYVTLTVTDTGLGIAPEVLAHVFEPFFTTKEPGKGTGLGLSMVYGIVKQSGGYITVDSAVGKGTRFRIYLPRVDEAEETAIEQATPAERGQGSGTILLVEDEVAVRELVYAILTSHGYKVLTAETAAHAASVCRSYAHSIDVLLTDVVMPGVGGPELARELLTLRPGLKIVYMSGYPGESLAELGVGAEAITLLQKPFTARELQEKIHQTLSPMTIAP